LTKKLANYFNTNYVQEWGRIIVNKTQDCTYQNILDIGHLHAKDIIEKTNSSNKLLFSDNRFDYN
jgi:nicotinamide riboside kinase